MPENNLDFEWNSYMARHKAMFGKLDRYKDLRAINKEETIQDQIIRGRLDELSSKLVSAKSDKEKKGIKRRAYALIRGSVEKERARRKYRQYFNSGVYETTKFREDPEGYRRRHNLKSYGENFFSRKRD